MPFLVFILSTFLFSVVAELIGGGEDARVGAGTVLGEELAAALLCWTLRAFFSAKGQPDTLWWTEYFPFTWPTPLQPGVGHLLQGI